jgi:hypothetical protein
MEINMHSKMLPLALILPDAPIAGKVLANPVMMIQLLSTSKVLKVHQLVALLYGL